MHYKKVISTKFNFSLVKPDLKYEGELMDVKSDRRIKKVRLYYKLIAIIKQYFIYTRISR